MTQDMKNHDDPMRVGTLTYTKLGLVLLFVWMLWGDFWFAMMGVELIPRLLPLSLKTFEASNALIGLVVGSLASVINMIVNPFSMADLDIYLTGSKPSRYN